DVSIWSADGTEVARDELAEVDGDASVTRAIVVRAPLDVGEQRWRAVIAAHKTGGVLHEETSSEFSFTTVAHAASVHGWGLPPAIAAGERFSFKVGIKCSAGCRLSGRPLCILDGEGAEVATGTLRDVWPGTDALYFAEVEARAPLTTGDHTWQ